MQKAKSRLARESAPQPTGPAIDSSAPLRSHAPAASQRPSLIVRYLTHLPTLVLSAPFGALVYYVLTHISPTKVANWPVPNAYLALILPVFLCLFWLCSFVLLKARRGLLLSTLLTLYLFLRLQQVVFTWPVVLIPALIVVGVEVLFLGLSKLTLSKR